MSSPHYWSKTLQSSRFHLLRSCLWVAFWVIQISVGISRVFIATHFPHQVVLGLVTGELYYVVSNFCKSIFSFIVDIIFFYFFFFIYIMQVFWLVKCLITSLPSTTRAWKCTSRLMLSCFLLLFAFISSSNSWTLIHCGQSLKPRSGVPTQTGFIWTPHLLLVWWETWEPCLVWASRSTLRCSFWAVKGRTATTPHLGSCAWLQRSHFYNCMTASKSPLTLRLCFTCYHFVKVP